ncbi:MAG: TatD family hydrolase [Deferribacterota bacterium]|nr:TatD family hydrolase [Deferribacterota bacterium]
MELCIKKKDSAIHKDYLKEIKNLLDSGYSITDTHSHIHFNNFNEDLEEAIKRALDFGVKRLITVGINKDDIIKASKIAHSYNNIYFAAAYHPTEISEFREDDTFFNEIFNDKKCIAIGETGLDYYRDTTNINVQKKYFDYFLHQAKKHNKPIIIHCRSASNDLIDIAANFIKKNNQIKGVLHCFNGDKKLLEFGIKNNLYFSFAGNVTFTKSSELRSAISKIPLSRIILETDCPFLSPMPYRGKRNEPVNIIYTLYTVHKVINKPLDSCLRIFEENVERLFFNQ